LFYYLYLQHFILENGSGKIDLIKAGAYDDADVSLMVHPG
jgi:hypothetical protein